MSLKFVGVLSVVLLCVAFNGWSDWENAIDVGTVVFKKIGKFWSREVEGRLAVGEQIWRVLGEYGSEVNE